MPDQPTTLDAGAIKAACWAFNDARYLPSFPQVMEAAIRAFLETLAGPGTMVLTTLEQLQAEKQRCFDEGKAAARPAPAVLVDAPRQQKLCFTHCGDACNCEAGAPTPQASAVEAEVRDWMRRSGDHLARALAAEAAITAARLAEAEEILAMVDALEYRQPGKTMLQTAADQVRARIAALKAAAAGEGSP